MVSASAARRGELSPSREFAAEWIADQRCDDAPARKPFAPRNRRNNPQASRTYGVPQLSEAKIFSEEETSSREPVEQARYFLGWNETPADSHSPKAGA